MRKIILASASPRRKELLEQIGLTFEVEPSNHDEDVGTYLQPHEIAVTLSRAKAQTVAPNHPDTIIIAADTFVVLGDRIIGKPHNPDEATEMLTALSGKSHSVITGLTLLDTGSGKIVSRSVETIVQLKQLTRDEIEAYVRSGEPIGKAGAYAIQGTGAVLIDGIVGDYSNVVGLPLKALSESLAAFDVAIL